MHLKTAGRIMIAGTLVLALAAQGVSGAVATGGEGSYYREKEHEQVSLADMDRKSFNEEEFRKAASELKQVCREEGQEDRVAELYAVVLDQTNRLSTVSALAMLDYYSDMNDDAAAEWNDEVTGLYSEIMDEAAGTLREVLNSGYGEIYREEMGDYNADVYQYYEDMTEEEEALIDRQQELVSEYEEKLMDDYDSQEEENQVLGQLFLELLQVRTEIAQAGGYDNYADYAYEAGYFRDYTVEDVENLRQEVKEELVPFFYDLTGRALDRGVNDVFEEYDVSSEELLETFAPYMEAISPEVGEAFGFFREQQLYDLDSSEDKISMAYTVELPAYGSAYIYDNRSGMYYDIFTVVHECGHFNSVYHDDTPALYTNINMDVSEIHSQGLELLFYPYYEQMYPGMGSAMQFYAVYEMFNNILLSCAFDEVENAVYRNPDLTLEEINSLMDEVGMEYGLVSQSVNSETWVEMTHLFMQPFYMISYGTSALAALELFRLSADDRDKAVDCYMQISAYATAEPYCAVMEACGLEDIFEEGTVTKLKEDLDDIVGITHDPVSGQKENDGSQKKEQKKEQLSLPEWLEQNADNTWKDLGADLEEGFRDTSFGGYRELALAVILAIGAAAAVSTLLCIHMKKKKHRDNNDLPRY